MRLNAVYPIPSTEHSVQYLVHSSSQTDDKEPCKLQWNAGDPRTLETDLVTCRWGVQRCDGFVLCWALVYSVIRDQRKEANVAKYSLLYIYLNLSMAYKMRIRYLDFFLFTLISHSHPRRHRAPSTIKHDRNPLSSMRRGMS